MPLHIDSNREGQMLPKYVRKYVWGDGRDRSGIEVDDYVDLGNLMEDKLLKPEGQVCPNTDCHLDQRWRGFRGLACPECATKLVVACRMCDSPATEDLDDGVTACDDHIGFQTPTKSKYDNKRGKYDLPRMFR